MNIIKWHGLDVDPMKIKESATTTVDIGQIETQFNESTQESGITMLYPRIEAIHEGRTRNFNRYTAEKLKGDYELKSGVYSWTQPYPKPVIHNHDIETEATGRVYSATWTEYTQAGRPGIIVTPKITQEKAIKDILEGRLLTVSIGATTNAAICSLCKTDIINEGYCGHMRGEEYDGHTVEWIAGDLWFDELSWVNVPADPDAMILGSNLTDQNQIATMESKKDSIHIGTLPADSVNPIKDKTKIEAGTITAGTINTSEFQQNMIAASVRALEARNETQDSSTTLTPEDAVVKSVSESQEKEEEKVEKTPEVTPETPQETTLDTAPVSTQEQAPVAEATPEAETQTQEATPVEQPAVTEESQVQETAAPVEEQTKVEETADLGDDLADLKEQLKDLKESLEDMKASHSAAVSDKRQEQASFLVDLRISMGKETAEDREGAIARYMERSEDSVKDSIQDLLTEQAASKARTVVTVEKPEGELITESKTLATENTKVISNEDVLLSLLTGRRQA